MAVVCPASLKWQWRAEALKHFNMDLEVLGGTRPRPCTGPLKPKAVVINYDVLGKIKDGDGRRTGPGWLEYLRWLEPKLLVWDEIHFLGSHVTKRAAWAEQLCRDVPHVVGLSGTPLTNRPIELWFPLKLIKPTLFPNRYRYGHEFCRPRRTPWGVKYDGAANLGRLHRILVDENNGVFLRRRKEDVLQELPPKRRAVVPLELAPAARREYAAAQNDFLGWLRQTAPERYHKARHNEALLKVGYLLRLAVVLKLPLVRRWLDDFLATSEGKLIVFSVQKTKVLRPLYEHYARRAVIIDGDVPVKERYPVEQAFLRKRQYRLLFGQAKAAGVGWNALGVSDIALVELPWAPGDVGQMEDRCVAKGSPVLTPLGWRPVEDIKPGDLVISHTGAHCKVLQKWNRPSTGKLMVDITIHGFPHKISSTSDHRFLTRDRSWIEAANLRPGDWLVMPSAEGGSELTSLQFVGKRISDTFYRGKDLMRNARLKHAPEVIEITDDFLFTLGYFAGDGYTNVGEGAGRAVHIAGNNGKKLPAMDRCRRWFVSQGLHELESADGVSLCRSYFSAEWAFWFRGNFGGGAHNKKLPEFLLRLNERQSGLVLEGLACSDGCKNIEKGTVEYSTVSDKLAGCVFALALRAGHQPSFRLEGKRKQQKIVRWGGCGGSSKFAGRVRSVLIRYPHKENGWRERVFDLEVERDHTFTVGGAVVHNCHGIGRGVEGVRTFIRFLVAKDTVEEKLVKLLQAKQKNITKVLDGKGRGNDLDIYDKLLEELERGA
jgi:hypothetical protein